MIETKTKMTCELCGRTELLPRDGQARRRWRILRIEKEQGERCVIGTNIRDGKTEYAKEFVVIWRGEACLEICGSCYQKIRRCRFE